jgi:hypothetical protein
MNNLEEQIAPQVRTMQVIVAGLAASPVVFAVVAHLLPQPPLNGDARSLLIRVALTVGLLTLVGQNVVQRVVAKQATRAARKIASDDPVRFAGAYLSSLLLSSGIAEAGAMICLLVYWMTRDQLTFAMAILLVLSNLLKYPTAARVAVWAEGQMKRQAPMTKHQ